MTDYDLCSDPSGLRLCQSCRRNPENQPEPPSPYQSYTPPMLTDAGGCLTYLAPKS